MANEALITRFYTAFAARDAVAMGACYHPGVHFSDPVFPELHGDDARAMWSMLCARGKDLTIAFRDVRADSQRGSASWIARYTFSASGRFVTNRINAEFELADGLIVRHTDRFSLYAWARSALGPTGVLLGWTPLVQSKIRRQAAAALRAWRAKEER